MLSPDVWRLLAAQRFLSPDGASHSFDSRANGYGRGEGIGIILLKPLDDALRDNDVIRAVIRVSQRTLLTRLPPLALLSRRYFVANVLSPRGAESTKTARHRPLPYQMLKRR